MSRRVAAGVGSRRDLTRHERNRRRTEPDRHIHTLSVTCVILSEALFATYVPVDVRESAPRTTPPSYWHAMMVVCGGSAEGETRVSVRSGGAFESVWRDRARRRVNGARTGTHPRGDLLHHLRRHAERGGNTVRGHVAARRCPSRRAGARDGLCRAMRREGTLGAKPQISCLFLTLRPRRGGPRERRPARPGGAQRRSRRFGADTIVPFC